MSGDRQRKVRAARLRRKRIAPAGYTAEAETAEELNVTQRTLRAWRRRGIGPPYVEIGRRIYYPTQHREAWIKSRVVHPAREEAAASPA
jgi:hypothetical protein